MDFKDSPEDAAFRAELRAWLEANAERKPSAERNGVPLFTDDPDDDLAIDQQKAWQKTLYDAGWGIITWPKAYGGLEATPTQAFVYKQEMNEFDVPDTGIYLVGHGMVGPTIITHGTPEQKEKWIPKLAEGSEVWCQLWSEPEAGSDLASLRTKAERDAGSGDWVLNGQKVWTTGARESRWGLIVARTDPDAPKHRGITCFVVDMTAPGVEVRPLRQMTGGAEFNEVFFTDVRIPDDQRMGDINDGWRVAMTTLMHERYAVGTGGAGEDMVLPLVRLAQKVSRNGGRAYDDASLRDEITRAYVQAKLLTLTGYRSLTLISKQGAPGAEGSIMKLVRTKLLSEVADLGTQVLGLEAAVTGPDGVDDGLWSLNYVGAIGARIGGGTDEIMKNIIGERVLGLPKEPMIDKDVPFRELRTRAGAG
jgi:acyl-CoA dehydrogenase